MGGEDGRDVESACQCSGWIVPLAWCGELCSRVFQGLGFFLEGLGFMDYGMTCSPGYPRHALIYQPSERGRFRKE